MSHPTETREGYQRDLVADILRSGGRVRLQTLGTSMLPSVWPGDLLLIDGNPEERVTIGDLALVERGDRFFVHRVVGGGGKQGQVRWITRGDALSEHDPSISPSAVLGRVAAIYRNGRGMIPRRKLSRLRSALGWILSHSTSFRSLALHLHAVRCKTVPADRVWPTLGQDWRAK